MLKVFRRFKISKGIKIALLGRSRLVHGFGRFQHYCWCGTELPIAVIIKNIPIIYKVPNIHTFFLCYPSTNDARTIRTIRVNRDTCPDTKVSQGLRALLSGILASSKHSWAVHNSSEMQITLIAPLVGCVMQNMWCKVCDAKYVMQCMWWRWPRGSGALLAYCQTQVM